MKTYDRVIRFYASWFGDLMAESKEFTDAECWQVVRVLYLAEDSEDPDMLDTLPREIKRALSLETMKTQLAKLISSSRSARERGKAGAAASLAAASRVDVVAAQQRAREESAQESADKWLQWIDVTPDDRIIDFARKGRIPANAWAKLWRERPDFVAYMRDKGVRVPSRPEGLDASAAEKALAIVANLAK